MVEVKLQDMKEVFDKKSIALKAKWLQGRVVFVAAAMLIVGLPVSVYGAYVLAYFGKIYPGVSAGGMNLGNKSGTAATVLIDQAISQDPQRLTLIWNDKDWELNLTGMGLKYDAEKTVIQAMKTGRDREIDKWEAWFKGINVPLAWDINEEALVGGIATEAGEGTCHKVKRQWTGSGAGREWVGGR